MKAYKTLKKLGMPKFLFEITNIFKIIIFSFKFATILAPVNYPITFTKVMVFLLYSFDQCVGLLPSSANIALLRFTRRLNTIKEHSIQLLPRFRKLITKLSKPRYFISSQKSRITFVDTQEINQTIGFLSINL